MKAIDTYVDTQPTAASKEILAKALPEDFQESVSELAVAHNALEEVNKAVLSSIETNINNWEPPNSSDSGNDSEEESVERPRKTRRTNESQDSGQGVVDEEHLPSSSDGIQGLDERDDRYSAYGR